MSELARRVLTAAILVPMVVWGVLALPLPWFALVAGLFLVAGAWEWSGLAGWPGRGPRSVHAGAMAALLAGAWFLLGSPPVVTGVLVLGCAFWGLVLVWVSAWQRGGDPAALRSGAVRALAGILLLVPCWLALVALHGGSSGGPRWVLALLVLIWGADTGAYFAGKRWGRRRLAGRVSPGKSLEGVAGGLAVVAIGAAAVGLGLGWSAPRVAALVGLSIATALVSVLGDLAESLFKRRVGLKDSGVLVPGHGGVLDRIDSLTAAAPFFALGHRLLGGDL